MEGCKVLDLGCGAGRDVYVLSQLVGEKGHVYGVDMTPEQLETANKLLNWHMEKFFGSPEKINVTFHQVHCTAFLLNFHHFFGCEKNDH